MANENEKLVNECKAFMRDVGLVTDNNRNYYSPYMDKDEWLVSIWSDSDIKVINDVYIADNECVICTTHAEPIQSLEEFKEKLTSAIERSKKLTVYLRRKTIDRDFDEDE